MVHRSTLRDGDVHGWAEVLVGGSDFRRKACRYIRWIQANRSTSALRLLRSEGTARALSLDLRKHLQVEDLLVPEVEAKAHQLVDPACAVSPGNTLAYQGREIVMPSRAGREEGDHPTQLQRGPAFPLPSDGD